MDYKEKYEMALETIQEILDSGEDSIKMSRLKLRLQSVFPELKESKDEKVRKGLIKYFRNFESESLYTVGLNEEEILAWLENQDEIFTKKDVDNAYIEGMALAKHELEKQGEQKPCKLVYYIRFGNIPSDEKSKIYRNEEEIGIEEGVSVYPAFESNGDIVIGLSLPITQTTLYTQQHLLEYESRPCYLVTGDCVGKGSDGEPLIKNVRIIKEIKPYRVKQDKENNTYVINNTPNCGISVYNEELKESEDEQHRKWILEYLYDGLRKSDEQFKSQFKCAIAWLEKQDKKNRLIEE